MKISDKPTDCILVKASTNSEWDNCEFAIIHLSEQWKKTQAERLEWVTPLRDKRQLCSLTFRDTAIDFYVVDEENSLEIGQLLNGKEWVFVALDKHEQETFSPTENALDCYRLVIQPNGIGYYRAYGKHTNEEFWTEEFNLNFLCFPIAKETALEKLCKQQFQHLTNAQLVERVNNLPDFGWDDEGVELQRRRRVSYGAFDYAFNFNTMVILKNEQR